MTISNRNSSVFSVCIVKLSSVGDIVHALPVAATLKHSFEKCAITWITEKPGAQLLQDHPSVDNVVVADTKSWRKQALNPTDYYKLVRDMHSCLQSLRSQVYDAVVDLQGLIKSGIIMRLLKSGERWGFPPYRCREKLNSLFSNKHISDSLLHGHVVEQNLAFAYLMGCTTPVLTLEFPCPDAERTTVDDFMRTLAPDRKKIIINPGTGWHTKTWPWQNYSKICEYLFTEKKTFPILTWGPGEENLVKSIHEENPGYCGIAPQTNLRQLAYMLRKSDLVIGGDTGPIHMAAAQQVPVVAIMGPSDPARNGPYNTINETVYHHLECSGCYKKQCDDPRCITDITVDEVIEAVGKIMR